jgi:hypothetical protein
LQGFGSTKLVDGIERGVWSELAQGVEGVFRIKPIYGPYGLFGFALFLAFLEPFLIVDWTEGIVWIVAPDR